MHLRSSLSQAAQGVESIINDIEVSINNYVYSEPVQGLLREPRMSSSMLNHFNAAKSSVNTITSINQNIMGIAIIPPEGTYYSFGLQDQYLYISSIRDDVLEKKEKAFDGSLDNTFGDNQAYFTYTLPIYSVEQGQTSQLGQYLGTCIAFCKKQAFNESIDAALLEGMSIELRTHSERILVSQNQLQNNAVKSPLINTYEFESPSWMMVQRYYNTNQMSPYPLFVIASSLIALGVLALLSVIVHRNFTLPIMQINTELLRIANRSLEPATLVINCKNELNTIAQSINTLIRHLQEAYKKQAEQENHMLRTQLSMNQLQLALLQNQINPHFLYNTLACIRGIALSNQVQVIADIVSNMANLYRYSIKGGVYVQLKEEIDTVFRYLSIMNLRMNNKFKIEIEVPELLIKSWAAKMILQPLVENAVFHGLECKEEGGRLRIYTTHYEGEAAFLLHVYDNGMGMDAQTVTKLNGIFNQSINQKNNDEDMNAKGMGLLNVHRKVRLLHGDAFGLHVESQLGQHTRVSILLPLIQERPSEKHFQ